MTDTTLPAPTLPAHTGTGITPCTCDTPDVATCGHCERQWCARCNPAPAGRCPYEYDHETDPFDQLCTADQRRLATADGMYAVLNTDDIDDHVLNEVFAAVLAPLASTPQRMAQLIADGWLQGATQAWRRLAPGWAAEDARLRIELTLTGGADLTLTELADGSYELWASDSGAAIGDQDQVTVPLSRDELTALVSKVTEHLNTPQED